MECIAGLPVYPQHPIQNVLPVFFQKTQACHLVLSSQSSVLHQLKVDSLPFSSQRQKKMGCLEKERLIQQLQVLFMI